MKKILKITGIVITLFCVVSLVKWAIYSNPNRLKLQDGDMIFHTSFSGNSTYIQIGTFSRYSHCGVIFHKNGKPYVLEGVNPVRYISLDRWIKRGVGGQYTVMRWKDQDDLTPQVKKKMRVEGEKFLGKPYDSWFVWNDNKIYCSELNWKVYERAGLHVCEPRKFKTFFGTSLPVAKKYFKRKGVDLESIGVPPSDLAESSIMKTIYSNYNWFELTKQNYINLWNLIRVALFGKHH